MSVGMYISYIVSTVGILCNWRGIQNAIRFICFITPFGSYAPSNYPQGIAEIENLQPPNAISSKHRRKLNKQS